MTFLEKVRKKFKKGQKKGAGMNAFPLEFQVFQKMEKCVSTAPARADWGSGHSFSVFLPSLLRLLFAIVFACFLVPPGSPDS